MTRPTPGLLGFNADPPRAYRRSCGTTLNGAGNNTSSGSSSTATAAACTIGCCGAESSSFCGSSGPLCRNMMKRTQYSAKESKTPPATRNRTKAP